jgi:hypothetical protein
VKGFRCGPVLKSSKLQIDGSRLPFFHSLGQYIGNEEFGLVPNTLEVTNGTQPRWRTLSSALEATTPRSNSLGEQEQRWPTEIEQSIKSQNSKSEARNPKPIQNSKGLSS